VHRSRLVTGLAAAFGLMTLMLAVGGLATNPVLLVVAVLFGVVTYLLYEHASGRLLTRVYRSVERQAATNTGARAERGGFGAGPREAWTPPRQEQRRRARQRARQRYRGRQGVASGQVGEGPSPREARDVLGVDPGAEQSTLRAAYRERIKEVHPDTDGGDEAEFNRVQAAYERLTE
jgi:predicted outer membrane lipoprotein